MILCKHIENDQNIYTEFEDRNNVRQHLVDLVSRGVEPKNITVLGPIDGHLYVGNNTSISLKSGMPQNLKGAAPIFDVNLKRIIVNGYVIFEIADKIMIRRHGGMRKTPVDDRYYSYVERYVGLSSMEIVTYWNMYKIWRTIPKQSRSEFSEFFKQQNNPVTSGDVNVKSS